MLISFATASENRSSLNAVKPTLALACGLLVHWT